MSEQENYTLSMVFAEDETALLRLVHRRLRNLDDAKEVMQEIAVACASNEAYYRHDEARKIARGILRRKTIDRWRRQEVRSTHMRRYALEPSRSSLVASADNPLQQAIRAEESQFLTALISRLTDRDRRLMLGCVVQGRRLRELADELGISVSTAHLTLRKAISRLAGELAAHYGEKER